MTGLDDQWYAYAAGRSTHHRTNVRHAVDRFSHVCGAAEVECRRPGIKSLIYLGEWESGHPENCRICVALLVKA